MFKFFGKKIVEGSKEADGAADKESKESNSFFSRFKRAKKPEQEVVAVKKAPRPESSAGSLCRAARQGMVHALHIERTRHKADLGSVDADGTTPLHWSSKQGDMELTRYLVNEAKVAVDVISDTRNTPLHWACLKGHTIVVMFLLQSGANPMILNSRNWTPLHAVCSRKFVGPSHLNIAIALLKSPGMDVDVSDEHGLTALHWACRHGHGNMVALLLNVGAKADGEDERGWKALHWACRGDHLSVVQELFRQEPKLLCDEAATDGTTPMLLAATYGSIKLTRFLQMKGAKSPQESAAQVKRNADPRNNRGNSFKKKSGKRGR